MARHSDFTADPLDGPMEGIHIVHDTPLLARSGLAVSGPGAPASACCWWRAGLPMPPSRGSGWNATSLALIADGFLKGRLWAETCFDLDCAILERPHLCGVSAVSRGPLPCPSWRSGGVSTSGFILLTLRCSLPRRSLVWAQDSFTAWNKLLPACYWLLLAIGFSKPPVLRHQSNRRRHLVLPPRRLAFLGGPVSPFNEANGGGGWRVLDWPVACAFLKPPDESILLPLLPGALSLRPEDPAVLGGRAGTRSSGR